MKKITLIMAFFVLMVIISACEKTGTNTNTNVMVSNVNRSTNTIAVNTNSIAQNINQNTNTAALNVNLSGQNANQAVNANSAAAQQKTVSVTSSGFSPRTITINVGDTVVWTNNDSQSHYIAPNDHPVHLKYQGTWNDDGTGNISNGETYTKLFSKSGIYEYHDHWNPELTGIVVVE